MTTLTWSKTPTRNRQTSDSGSERESPKPMVARPKPATVTSSTRPGRRQGLSRVRARAMVRAPSDGAARSQPRPTGPTPRMSLAKIGSRATAPPRSTAKRSSVIAARKTGLWRMKAKPANRSALASSRPSGLGLRAGSVASAATKTAWVAAAAR